MSASEERREEYGIQEWLVAEKIGQSYDHKPQEYITSLKRRLVLGAQAKELFDRYQYDIYLCSAPRWQPAMASGYPTISIPVGQFLPETPINSRPKTGMIQKAPGIPWVTPPARVNLDDEVAYAFGKKSINIRDSLSLKVESTSEIKATAPLSHAGMNGKPQI